MLISKGPHKVGHTPSGPDSARTVRIRLSFHSRAYDRVLISYISHRLCAVYTFDDEEKTPVRGRPRTLVENVEPTRGHTLRRSALSPRGPPRSPFRVRSARLCGHLKDVIFMVFVILAFDM